MIDAAAPKFRIDLTGDARHLSKREEQRTGAITPTRIYGSNAGNLYEGGGMESVVYGLTDARVSLVGG